MKFGKFLLVLVVLFALSGCQKAEQVRKVSFTLYSNRNPEAAKEIMIFAVEGDEIRISKDNRLGVLTTDAQGRATLEFRSPAKFSEYALVSKLSASYSVFTSGGKTVTFRCDESKPACELGDIVFDGFEFFVDLGEPIVVRVRRK